MLRLLLLIAYCTSLCSGEAVRLRLDDVDLQRRILNIRERTFVVRRAAAQTVVDALFVGLDGRAASMKAASEAVRFLVRKLGMKPPKGRTGPRPCDLRHAFAVHRLTDWYRSGVDIRARLPWLSAYMGHENLLGTEVYLHAVPELLRLASDRLAARLSSAGPRP
jgi:integrase